MLLYTLAAPIPTEHGVTPLALLDGNIGNLIGEEFYVIGQSNQAGRNVVDDAVIVTFDGGVSPSYAVQYSYDTDANGGTGGLDVEILLYIDAYTTQGPMFRVRQSLGSRFRHVDNVT